MPQFYYPVGNDVRAVYICLVCLLTGVYAFKRIGLVLTEVTIESSYFA